MKEACDGVAVDKRLGEQLVDATNKFWVAVRKECASPPSLRTAAFWLTLAFRSLHFGKKELKM